MRTVYKKVLDILEAYMRGRPLIDRRGTAEEIKRLRDSTPGPARKADETCIHDMRFLDTRTGRFRSVRDPGARRYAILSHTWSREGEQSYQDIVAIQADVDGDSILGDARLTSKVRDACALALRNGYDLLWIDACCIDKSSSAELTEAINSMFKWYRLAAVCYAYLDDVHREGDAYLEDGTSEDKDIKDLRAEFRRARWHTRGWTLQELIAPRSVVFLSKDWEPFGTKEGLAGLLESITGVSRDVLTHKVPFSSIGVARWMLWGARRQTTRAEDGAYSLMGILGIFMAPIYGEGHNAHTRLRDEIEKRLEHGHSSSTPIHHNFAEEKTGTSTRASEFLRDIDISVAFDDLGNNLDDWFGRLPQSAPDSLQQASSRWKEFSRVRKFFLIQSSSLYRHTIPQRWGCLVEDSVAQTEELQNILEGERYSRAAILVPIIEHTIQRSTTTYS